MKLHLVAACVAIAPTFPFAVPGETTQNGAPSNSLARALAVFSASDADHDGKISAAEARAIPVAPEEIAKADLDGDGSWSRDEFTLYYRARLIAGGQTVGQDLDAEVARIQALKRVRIVEEARKQGAETPGRRCEVEPACVRFERALADLEASATAKKAKPEDFRRLRNLVILSGRAVPGSKDGNLSSSASASMLQAVDRIEKRAAAGQCSHEDFEALRSLATSPAPVGELNPRSANAPTPPGTLPPAANPGNAADRNGPIQGPAAARRRAIDPRGSTRPAPKTPPPPDSAKPPAPSPPARPPSSQEAKKDSGSSTKP